MQKDQLGDEHSNPGKRLQSLTFLGIFIYSEL